MRKLRLIIIYISAILILCLIFNSKQLNKDKEYNVEKMSDSQIEDMCITIVNGMLDNKKENIDKFREFMTEDTYSEILQVLKSKKYKGSLGDISFNIINTENSETKDYVIMFNFKVQPKDLSYNTCNLMELHVNKDGKIYGFNIWNY